MKNKNHNDIIPLILYASKKSASLMKDGEEDVQAATIGMDIVLTNVVMYTCSSTLPNQYTLKLAKFSSTPDSLNFLKIFMFKTNFPACPH